MPTDHPKVLRAKNGALPIGLSTVVDVLVDGARNGRPDDEIRELLVRLVPEFKLSAEPPPRRKSGSCRTDAGDAESSRGFACVVRGSPSPALRWFHVLALLHFP